MKISCGVKKTDYGYDYIYVPNRKELYCRPFIMDREYGIREISGWLTKRDLNWTEADLIKYRKEAFYGCYLKNWFEYFGSDYSIGHLGDIRITGENNGDRAVYINHHGTDENFIWKESQITAPIEKLAENREEVTEWDGESYVLTEGNSGEICFRNDRSNPYYDEKYINLYLNGTGTRNYDILYADEKYLCIWKENGEGKQETILLDLYQTNFCGEPLSVGESREYAFNLPIGELAGEIAEGRCRADAETYWFAQNSSEAYAGLLKDYFNGREYMYKTYLTESGIGFLIPVAVWGDERYMRLEVEYNWKAELPCRQPGYAPEELGKIHTQNDRVLSGLSDGEDGVEAVVSICMQTGNMMQVKCTTKNSSGGINYRYILYQTDTQEEMRLEDIVEMDGKFVRWLMVGKKVEGDLTKASYSVAEGWKQTVDMLRNCPQGKLEDALEECEFYLEPGLLHIKLPYWDYKFLKSGWMENGEGEIWKSWLTIRTEDIEEFLKVEKW